ncbi:chorion peroxidase [Epargyreus clarus]|uniref:chorion peroxidase n=1 Tax=Epargyreus clarus TaxID=520877 RepID=UPI003C2E7558
MKVLEVFFHTVLCTVIVCPIDNVYGHGKFMGRHYEEVDTQHAHSTEPPCATCPRHGVCVPRVQCPAHVRPGAQSPECHIGGTRLIGVCCFTGRDHAAESDHKARSSIPAEDLKEAHARSRQKLTDWLIKAEKLNRDGFFVKESAPSYGHHLSVHTYDERADKLGHGGLLNMFAAEELKARQAISEDELAFGFTDQADGPFCPPPPVCPSTQSRYRSIEGHCNNPSHPAWGAANTGYRRLLPPDYSDGVWAIRRAKSGQRLPSARAVSSSLLLDGSHPSRTHNLMFMQFGQFLTHDVTAGVVFNGNGSAISCCSGDGEDVLPEQLRHWACAPIIVEPDDPFFSKFGHRCINFVRTQLAPSSECTVGYAQQMNGVTHYIDLSQLYGSSVEKLVAMRGPRGLLKVFNDFGRELPPLVDRNECLNDMNGAACFESGDNHGNQIISLTALHTIWTREHNRVARDLGRINPIWNEDKVFMETRRILQAEFQHIVYNEWLPLLLGPEIMKMFGLSPSAGYSSSYNPRIDPSITVEFSTSAMRFGHSVVDSKIMIPSPKKGDVHETISIPEVMFQPSRMRIQPFLDRLLIGLTWQPMQTVDPFVSEALSRYLFHGGNPFGLDLAAINIQRGRDYGVRTYNVYRKLIGLTPFTDFGQFPHSAAARLAAVYNSPEDIDLWVGGLLEEHVEGGIVGTTFAHIIADQFARLKNGDRFFYQHGPDINPGAFTLSQLAEIRKVTFSRIICDNSDGIELISQPPKAFLKADLPGNEPVPCNSPLIPSMDLNKFKNM